MRPSNNDAACDRKDWKLMQGSDTPAMSSGHAASSGQLGTRALQATLEHHLTVQFNLCCALEKVADSLPDDVDTREVLSLAKTIGPIVMRSHEFEEKVLFPVLRDLSDHDKGLAATLDRLHGEHWEDESYAEEVQSGLTDFVSGQLKTGVDTLAYMLRGFFEGLRRHIAFEREHLLPLLKSLDT